MNFDKSIVNINLIKILYIHETKKYKNIKIYKHLYNFKSSYVPLITSFLGLKMCNNTYRVYRYLDDVAYLNVSDSNKFIGDTFMGKNIMESHDDLIYFNEKEIKVDSKVDSKLNNLLNKLVTCYHVTQLQGKEIFNIGYKTCSTAEINEFIWKYNNNLQLKLSLLNDNKCYFEIIVHKDYNKNITKYLETELNNFIVIIDKLISYLNINND